MKPTLVVLAAGMGSRYGGLKQLDSVGPNSETIMDYSVYDALRAGFGKIIFIIRRETETEFKDTIGSRYKNLISVEYAFQEKNRLPNNYICPTSRVKPWGTGHALLMTKDMIGEPFAVINADDFYGQKAFALIGDFLNSINAVSYKYAMIGFILKNTLSRYGSVSRGICSVDKNNLLVDIIETFQIKKDTDESVSCADQYGKLKHLTGEEIVSMNIWGFSPSLFEKLEEKAVEFFQENINSEKAELYLPFVVDSMIKKNLAEVKVITSSDLWAGITYKEDKPQVVKTISDLVKNGVYPEKLF